MYHKLKKNSSMEYFTGILHTSSAYFCVFISTFFLDDYEKQTI